MSPTRRELQARAYAQAGYFTAAQALEAGYSYQAQKYHADRGNWERVARGLFRLPGWPSDRFDPYVRWTLWSKGRGVVSHETALVIHGISDVNPAKIHLTVPPGFRARDSHIVTHVGQLDEADWEERSGFRVTTVERTLLDVAGAGATQEVVDAGVRDALAAGLTTPRRLRRRAADASDTAALGIERALNAEAANKAAARIVP